LPSDWPRARTSRLGLASTALYFSKGGYTSAATIWVEKPLFGQGDSSLFQNVYASPAANQAEKFNQYLQTYQFALNIAKRVGLDMPTEAAEGRAVDDIQKNLNVTDMGPNLVGMVYTGETPDYCEPIVREAIALFAEEITANREQGAEQTLKLLQGQLVEAEQKMNKSSEELDKYLRLNPTAGSGGALDPTLSRLTIQSQTDKAAYDDIMNRIQNINNQTASTSVLLNYIWKVVDKPEAAEPYRMTLKDLLKNSILALAMALLTMVAITLVGTWTDSAVYTLGDVSSVATSINEDGPAPELLVGIVPYIKPLADIRKAIARHERATQGGRRKPRVTVMDGTEVMTRQPGAPDMNRQPDGLIDVASSAHAPR
jgi:hypothetical protein